MARARSRRFNPRVVALAYDGLCGFEFACAAEVFGLPRPELGAQWYRFGTCSLEGRDVSGQFGSRLAVNGGLELLREAGTIIVPGWQGVDAAVPEPILAALRDAFARGARLLSICSGSFVLAATGLLDGKRATTHWRYSDIFKSRHPDVVVDAAVLYVDEGQILTSAGSAAGLDLCLHLIRRDFGPQIANHVARRLVIPPHREGGQAQYLESPVDRREHGPLSVVLDRMLRQIHKPMAIREMARWAAMSERTFIRKFTATTGMTPLAWLVHHRIGRAKDLLERTSLSVEQIAVQSGFGTAVTMRHHFRRSLALSPVEYRNQFSGNPQ